MHKIEVIGQHGDVIDSTETEDHTAAAKAYIHLVLVRNGLHVRWSEHGLPGMPVITHAERFGPSEPVVMPDANDEVVEWRLAVAMGDTMLGYRLWSTLRRLQMVQS